MYCTLVQIKLFSKFKEIQSFEFTVLRMNAWFFEVIIVHKYFLIAWFSKSSKNIIFTFFFQIYSNLTALKGDSNLSAFMQNRNIAHIVRHSQIEEAQLKTLNQLPIKPNKSLCH